MALAFFALGAFGLTSVFSNYDPEICVARREAWTSKDTTRARRIHEVLRPVAEAMFIENSPAPVKYLSAEAGDMRAHVRLPIAEISLTSRTTLGRILGEYQVARAQILQK